MREIDKNGLELTMQTEKTEIKNFLTKANLKEIKCIDERPDDTNPDAIQLQELHEDVPVKIQGGTAGIVDGLKRLLNLEEDEAWDLVKNAGIPIAVHLGPVHGHNETEPIIGENGCGYNNLAENKPKEIDVPKSVKAESRVANVKRLDGKVYSVYGEHKIDAAVINWVSGKSIDTEFAREVKGTGILSCDAWAVESYAKLINETNPGINLDGKKLAEHIANQFRLVVGILAPNVSIEEIN